MIAGRLADSTRPKPDFPEGEFASAASLFSVSSVQVFAYPSWPATKWIRKTMAAKKKKRKS